MTENPIVCAVGVSRPTRIMSPLPSTYSTPPIFPMSCSCSVWEGMLAPTAMDATGVEAKHLDAKCDQVGVLDVNTVSW